MALITGSFLLQVFGVITALLVIAYVYVKNVTYSYWKIRGVAHERPVFPFGSLLPMVREGLSIGEFLRDSYLRLANERVIGIYIVNKPVLIVADPDLVPLILIKYFASFKNRGIHVDPKREPWSVNLFRESDEKWEYLREKFSPAFTSAKIRAAFDTISDRSCRLTESVLIDVRENRPVDIKDLMIRFTTDVVAEVAYGLECNCVMNPESEPSEWSRDMFNPRSRILMLGRQFSSLLTLSLYVQLGPRYDMSKDFFVNYISNKARESRRSDNVAKKRVLDILMRIIERNDDDKSTNGSELKKGKLSVRDGATHTSVFWLAGTEMPSTIVTWCLYELCQNQKMQDKLAAEINNVLGEHDDVTYDSLNEMPYLEKTLLETLRKYPPLEKLHRICNEDITLPGLDLRIDKGTPIIIPVLGFHSNPEFYPEPEKFDPERFSKENIAKRHRYVYLPFGDGPRMCFGKKLGIVQAKIAIVKLLSKYRFLPGPNLKVPRTDMAVGALVHSSKDRILLRVEGR